MTEPKTEIELINRCRALEGLSFGELAAQIGVQPDPNRLRRKGWVGMAIEWVLGASAGTQALPDFPLLGIELKTLPINQFFLPAESTFVTTVSLLQISQKSWHDSACYQKLKRVLWIPIEADHRIPFHHRRIGKALLWSPSVAQEAILKADWQELCFMVSSGKLAELDARMGQFLQIRPKAASSKSLSYGFNEEGGKIQTMPRGFYLRRIFTEIILKQHGSY